MIMSIYDIEVANARRGHHWFEPATMRFFNSRVCGDVFPLPDGGALFVSSERRRAAWGEVPAPVRRYTIRICRPTGEIDTVGEFQGFRTAAQAKRAAKKLADSWK